MTVFGENLEAAFLHRTSSLPRFGEIVLFRCLMDALGSLSPKYAVEEYHGSSKQVYFDPLFPWDGRTRARCELADLLIIWFSDNPEDAVRITFLQAKYERKNVQYPYKHTYSANLEQWDLLANRPEIDGVGQFSIPQQMLSDATLPSIGSFGFFYRANATVELFYSSADCLCFPASKKHRRYYKLKAKSNVGVMRNYPSGLTECIHTANLHDFGNALYSGLIGSPINDCSAGWLLNVLSNNSYGGVLAVELIERLRKKDTIKTSTNNFHDFGTTGIVLVKGSKMLEGEYTKSKH